MEYAQTTLNHLMANREDVRQKVEVIGGRGDGGGVSKGEAGASSRLWRAAKPYSQGQPQMQPFSSSLFRLRSAP